MGKRMIKKPLPQDIIEEILQNLPVKSLLRFKCVSKSWCSSISSKAFIKQHLKKSTRSEDPTTHHHNLIFIFKHHQITDRRFGVGSCSLGKEAIITPTFDNHPLEYSGRSIIRIVGSCNGLILITIRNLLLLWNPSTRQVKGIPPPSFDDDASQEDHLLHRDDLQPLLYDFGDDEAQARENSFGWPFYVNEAQQNSFGWYFDDDEVEQLLYGNWDSLQRHLYGLGYDESTDDYMVVSIKASIYGKSSHQARMYSSKTDSWKKIENFKGFPSYHPSKFVTGRLHWLNPKNGGGGEIVSLDLVEEEYQIVDPPKRSLSNYTVSRSILGELGGYLSLTTRGSDINVWVMMEYGAVESWTKIWTSPDFDDPRSCAMPLYLSKNGDIGVAFGSDILVYNQENELQSKCRVDKLDARLEFIVHVESLVSPFATIN